MYRSHLYFSVLALCVSSLSMTCRGETIPLDLAGMGEAAISDLEENGIWYRRLESGMVEVNRSDAERVIEIMDDLLTEALPPGRHNAFNALIQPVLKRQLRENGVEFSSICVSGSEFLVWDAGSSSEVHSLANSIRESLASSESLDDPKARQLVACP